jgi:large subunit ribosomal protein L4e
MKSKVFDINGTEIKEIKLPKQFDEPVRADLIKRAVLAIQSHDRQPYGAYEKAGQRHAVAISKRRRKYKGCYGHGISRTPRKIMSRRGTRFNWVGAFAPGTVGGRIAHPPKAEKIWAQKINKQERRKATRSAIAASVIKDLIHKNGHKVPAHYPIVIEEKFESIEKTKDVKAILAKLGLKDELKRTEKKMIRAGKGKMRGRKHKKKEGILIVVSKDCKLMKGAQNIPGLNIIDVKNLNAKILSHSVNPGRLTIYVDKAVEKLDKEKLFE